MSTENRVGKSAIQQDWDDREFAEMIQLNIVKIANFLNDFDVKVRTRISTLNERLNQLERTVDFCDAAAKSSQDRLKSLQNK